MFAHQVAVFSLICANTLCSMTQRGLLSKRLIVLTTGTAFLVTVGVLLASASCDFQSAVALRTTTNRIKDKSCLLELSNGRWELMTDGYVEPATT